LKFIVIHLLTFVDEMLKINISREAKEELKKTFMDFGQKIEIADKSIHQMFVSIRNE